MKIWHCNELLLTEFKYWNYKLNCQKKRNNILWEHKNQCLTFKDQRVNIMDCLFTINKQSIILWVLILFRKSFQTLLCSLLFIFFFSYSSLSNFFSWFLVYPLQSVERGTFWFGFCVRMCFFLWFGLFLVFWLHPLSCKVDRYSL